MKFQVVTRTVKAAGMAAFFCALTGCSGPPNRPEPSALGEVFQNALRGIAAGRAYDKALLAQGRDDDAAYLSATTMLRQSGAAKVSIWADQLTLGRAEESVLQGMALDAMAFNQPPAKREKWENRAMENYRRALAFSPDFPSQSYDLLNALGYKLADNGQSAADFKTAEKLTRASLMKLEKLIAQMESGSTLGLAKVSDVRYAAASGPRDSLAWALFKQKRYAEALKEQERAVADAKANRPTGLLGGGESLPDLLYHLGSIYAALGQIEKARASFDEALKLKPDHAETKAARAKL